MWFHLLVVNESNKVAVENITSYMSFWLARERGCETKTTELMADGSRSTWGLAQESEP